MGNVYYTDNPPDCDFCSMKGKKEPAKFDAATKDGRWANMCDTCMKIHGKYKPNQMGTGKGQAIRATSEKPAPVLRDAEDLDMDDIEEMIMGDGAASTSCPHGCEVEVDGTCPHGYKSHLLELGFV